jgi:hypothetical protein
MMSAGLVGGDVGQTWEVALRHRPDMASDIGQTSLEVVMSVIGYWLYSRFPLVLAIIAVVGCQQVAAGFDVTRYYRCCR